MIAEILLLTLSMVTTPAGTLAEAGSLLAQGRADRAEPLLAALALREDETGEDAALAMGWLLLERGHPATARVYLDRVAGGGGLLADWGRVLAARARAESGGGDEAIALLEGMEAQGPARTEALLLRAGLLAAAGRHAEAARDYQAFLDSAREHPRRREAAFLLASSLEGAGLAARAAAAYWAIWWDDPGAPRAMEARERALALVGADEDLSLPAADDEEVLEHAERLRKTGRSKEAAETYAALAARLADDARREAMYGEALSHYRGWRTREVDRVLDRLLSDPGRYRCRALALQARNLWIRASDRAGATKAARELADTCPWSVTKGEEGREEGLWVLAHQHLRAEEPGKAEPYLREMASHPNLRREAAAWNLGLMLLEQDRAGEAAKLFEALASNTSSSGYRAAALYWAARARATAEGVGTGEGWLRILVSEQPFSYYGFRALDLLAAEGGRPEPGSLPLPPGTSDVLPDSMRSLPGHARAVRLERAGLTDLAGSEFLALYTGEGDPPPALVLRVARAYASTRWAYRGVRLMRNTFRDWENVAVAGGEPEGFRSALYPRPFHELYERESRSRDMDPALALAISRQESLFDPEIRSWAGAVGLMQLMPETAAIEARRLGLPRPGEGDLADPALNVQLGVQHLDGLLERFGSVPAAVAAYNAGGGRVEKWLSQRPLKGEGAVSEDLWIDTIPITQTRLYVKAVLRALEEYRRQE